MTNSFVIATMILCCGKSNEENMVLFTAFFIQSLYPVFDPLACCIGSMFYTTHRWHLELLFPRNPCLLGQRSWHFFER